MKFTTSSNDFLKALMNVSKAIPAKSSLPILENYLLTLKDNVLEITASDSDITLKTSFSVNPINAESGAMAIPAKHINDILKALDDQTITIRTVGDNTFECAWETGHSTLPYYDAKDYPELYAISGNATTFTMDANTIIEGISSTVYATADDEIRPVLNGVHFDVNPEDTRLVATDSHKMVYYKADGVNTPNPASFILGKKPASILRGILNKEIDNVTVTYDENSVRFVFGKTTMTCRLTVGKFPNYKGVIPSNNDKILKIDRVKFLNTIKRISVCANKATNFIRLELSGNTLTISAQDLGLAVAAKEKMMCDYIGDDLTIGFKSSFLIEILSNMGCNTIVMKFADARKATNILPDESEAQNTKVAGILMPVMV